MSLLARINTFRPFAALLVGDFMLDQHVYGAAERLSPDAPVPVLQAVRTDDAPGGAANVALCLRGLKAAVHCFGVTGDDAEGKRLREALNAHVCDTSGLLVDIDRPTTVKRSLVGLAQHRHPQKMFRLDYESRTPISDSLRKQLLRAIESRIDAVDVVCLEDYNKGVCTPELCQALVALCRQKGKQLLIDPAAIDDYAKYRGATAVTPNRSEAELATGLDTPLEASELHNAGLASKLLKELDLEAVVLTLDRHGALLEERGGRSQLVPTVARNVYDVTGAGDMVLAALAAARANHFPWLEAVQFANAAAGLEVEVFGVQPIPLASIHREILRRKSPMQGKVRTLDELRVELAVHREAGERIVFTNGCFDVIHAGHVAYLREAKRCGHVLVVAINTDEQVLAQKGPGRPVYNQTERLEILSELNCIDYLLVFEEPTVDRLLRDIVPDVYVKGGDYEAEQINEFPTARELGIELRVLAHRPGLGSTDVIQRMLRTAKK